MTQSALSHIPPARPFERTSIVLRRAVAAPLGETVTLDELLERFERRSFGGVIMMLSIVALLPGLSALAGLLLLIPAAQMIIGMPALKLPGFLGRRPLPAARVELMLARMAHRIERIERWVKPRWLWANEPPMPMVTGAVVLLLALFLMLPVLLSNVPPAIALAVIALGVLESDGKALVTGLVLSVTAMAIGTLMAGYAIDMLIAAFA